MQLALWRIAASPAMRDARPWPDASRSCSHRTQHAHAQFGRGRTRSVHRCATHAQVKNACCLRAIKRVRSACALARAGLPLLLTCVKTLCGPGQILGAIY